MKIGHLRYFVSDAIDEWRHSPGVNLLATVTLTAALFLAGLVVLGLSNLGHHVERWKEDLRVHVYLRDDAGTAARERIQRALDELPETQIVTYVDKTEALRRFRESFGENLAGLPAELDTNPLPASLDVVLQPSANSREAAESVAAAVKHLDGVEEVQFEQAWLDRLDSVLRLARVGGGVLAILVFSAVVLVMASVLRLAVYARRDEIDIMQLVGAAPSFVRGPFLVAGLAQGFAGSLAALLLVEGVRRGILLYTDTAIVSVVAGHPVDLSIAALMIAAGLTVSFTGAYFAVRRTT